MPPRFLTLAIIAFWVAMTGWFLSRDLWPRLRPGDLPPFPVSLTDEGASTQASVRWEVSTGDGLAPIYDVSTWVTYHETDDTFELRCLVLPKGLVPENYLAAQLVSSQGAPLTRLVWFAARKRANLAARPGFLGRKGIGARDMAPGVLKWMDSTYRVSREGELREVDVRIKIGDWMPDAEGCDIDAHNVVTVKDRRFFSIWEIKRKAGDQKFFLEQDLAPVLPRGCLLNPLQPMKKLTRLREGQRWQTPLDEPWADALVTSAIIPVANGQPRILDAEVEAGTQMLKWNGREVPCQVISFRGTDVHDEASARVWARRSDGLVLRQETRLEGRTWLVKRMHE